MNTSDFFNKKLFEKLQKEPLLLTSSGICNKKISLDIDGPSGGKWTFEFGAAGEVQMIKDRRDEQAHCLIEMKDKTFEGMMDGSLNIPLAFMMRKIKVKGDSALAAKVGMALKSSVG